MLVCYFCFFFSFVLLVLFFPARFLTIFRNQNLFFLCNLRTIYPPEGCCESSSQGVQLILYPLNWCRKRFWGFQIYEGVRGLFQILKMFYPPKGRLLADSCRGPIGFTYVLFWVSKSLEAFQFTSGFLKKKNP